MGNRQATGKSSQAVSSSSCKVILSNGTVQQFHEELTVAELMLEHPQQVVVEFKSVSNSKRPEPLPADKVLEMKNVYMMIPVRRGRPVLALSTDEAHQMLTRANAMLKSNYSSYLSLFTGIIPFTARCIRPAGMKANNAVGCIVMEKKDKILTECSNAEVVEGPEYLTRRLSYGKEWKPSLDTIKEKVAEQKETHWLYH